MGKLHTINWTASLGKWITAVGTFRLNVSDIARESKVTRQHIAQILSGDSVPSVIVAQRIDEAIDAAVERRQEIVRQSIAVLEAAE